MKPKEALLLFALLLSAVAFGQNKVIPQPANRVLNIDGQWRDKDSRTSNKWDVASDRDDNQVYSDKSFSNEIPGFKLGFSETVYVLDYVPGVGLLIARPNKVAPTGAFTGNVTTEMGWVKEETMVLSRYSIRTKNNPLLPVGTDGLYTKKAFIFNRPGTFQLPSFYSKPTMSAGDVIGNFNIYTIFYIYKEVGDKLLLGQKPEKNSVADRNLIGWVSRNVISSWNHNMCFEKNWDRNAVEERGQLLNPKLPACIFGSRQDAESYKRGQQLFNDPLLYNEETDLQFRYTPNRMDGNIFRSPIIKTLEPDKLFEVGYLSRGAEEINESDRTQFISCFKDLLEQLNTINLVFMIDGTHSILPYKSTIVDNLTSAFSSLTHIVKGGDIKVKYNAIIYRDDPYTKKFSFMPAGMTTDYSQLISFVNTELVNPGNVRDDQPEAMYWGFNIIDQKLSTIRPFEKTFVIVVGDAGDHQRSNSPTFLAERAVLDLLKRKNYSVSAIQINHRTTDPTYNQFQSQFKNILTKYYREKYNIVIPENSIECIDTENNITRFPDKSLKIPSMVIYPPNGQSLSNEALGQQLTNLILAAPFADFKIDLPCRIPQSILTYLDISPNDPEFQRKALYGMFNSYYIQGFLPQFSINQNGQSNSNRLFNDVQFFKNDELKNIDDQLKILIPDNNSVSTRPPRERIFNAWQNILVNKLKVVDALSFSNTTLREASLFLTQNKGRAEWANIRMMDINNLSVFPDSLLAEYYYDWFTTKIMVQSILGNSSKFVPATLNQHSDVFKYCYDLFHPGEIRVSTGAQIQTLLRNLVNRSIAQHYSSLQYTDDAYIRSMSRCKGEIVTMTIDEHGNISQGGFLEVFWISGEYFPHENNYARLIFQN